MISIAIVEDDILCKEDVRKHLERYMKEKDMKFNISEFADGEEILEDYSGAFDLILMDIEMKFLDGMSTAKKIREIDTEVAIMFITNAPQYAINGYLVDALDYILKPINYFNFAQRLERALTKIKKRDVKYVTLNMAGAIKKIAIKDLLYIEVQNHDLYFKTKSDSFVTRGTLTDFEENLSEYNFFRCHRCYLVNIEKVDVCKGSEIEILDNVIPVSRGKKKELLSKLNDFLNEG